MWVEPVGLSLPPLEILGLPTATYLQEDKIKRKEGVRKESKSFLRTEAHLRKEVSKYL